MSAITFSQNDRIEMFVDLMNVETVLGRGKIDYGMLCRQLAKGRSISNVRVYDSKKEGDKQQEILHAHLKEQKFRIVMPEVKCGKSGKQVGVDVTLAIDVACCAITSHCDVIIIVSGDGDFVPLINKIKESGKKVEFASFKETANLDLIEATDRFITLDDLPIIYPEGVKL